jgi:hypothetical protein
MFDAIIDKAKPKKISTYIITSSHIEDILMLIDTAENFSEEIGYYSNKRWKDNLKERRDQVYNEIIEILYLNKI